MAEEVEEEPKKSNLLKIIIFVVGGILLIAVGLGIGYFLFGGEPEPDPSAEVNQIIEGKEAEKKKTEDVENKEEVLDKIILQREQKYQALCNYEMSTDNMTVQENCEKIMEMINV